LPRRACDQRPTVHNTVSVDEPSCFFCLPVVFARRQEHAQAGKPCPVQYYFMGPDATEATAPGATFPLPVASDFMCLGGVITGLGLITPPGVRCSKRLVMYYTPQVLPRRGQALSRAILFHGTRRYNNTLGGHGFRRYVASYFMCDVLFCRVQALSPAILFHGTRRYNNTLGGHGFRRYVNKTPETSPEDTISLESA